MSAIPAAIPAPPGRGEAVPIPAIIPGLDGLRAVSILLVMASHSGAANIIPGVFGVTLFFFISGFLITTLMLAEHRQTGELAVGAFYARRMIRLYPPLIASIGATVLVAAAYGEHIPLAGIVGALAYLANYLALFRPDLVAGLGGQLWSLAVEEHFYLVYPLAMLLLLPRPRLMVPVLGLFCLLALLARVYVEQHFPAIATDYTGKATECRIDSILYGALAAVVWWDGRARALMTRHATPLLAGALLLLAISFGWRNALVRDTLRYTLQGLALMPAVLAVTVAGTLPAVTRLLEAAPMRWIGRLSYSLYLWHLFGFELADRLVGHGQMHTPQAVVLGWGLVIGLSAASYRFVEKPFFALRKRFGSNVGSTDHGRAGA